MREDNLDVLVDSDILGEYDKNEVEQLIQIALLCTRVNPMERPTMTAVVLMLEGEGLAEKWEEWQQEEMSQISNPPNHQFGLFYQVSCTSQMDADILSGPR